MPNVQDTQLLAKVVANLRVPASRSTGRSGSILTISGARYTESSLDDDETRPTGFDPQAAALFEAVVESAYLVATADGEFDATERAAFEHVVLTACDGALTEKKLRALLADLEDLRVEDGVDKRLNMVARMIARPEQAKEVLRVAALIAHVSEGVSAVERRVLDRLAAECKLSASAVDEALGEVERALAE
jgi:tellurite resistance protein